MSGDVAAAILFAAFLHASWNALIKRDRDATIATIGVAAAAAAISLCLLPFLAMPARASWPFLAVSVVAESAYYLMIARLYRGADLSLAYPLMRGTAPLLVTLVDTLLFGEVLSTTAYFGIAGISAGVFLIAGAKGHASRPQTILQALGIAFVIAFYTLVDGFGVRRSASPVAYTLWIFLFTGALVAVWGMLHHRAALLDSLRRNPWPSLIGGGCTLVSYAIALWAMTRAPIAAVAALRETAILFAILISMFWLKEGWTARRGLAALLLTAGAVVIRLS